MLIVWNKPWEVHGGNSWLYLDAFFGGVQGGFGVASGMDRNSGRWDHDLGFFSHRYLKKKRKWRKMNASSFPRS